MTDSYSPPLAGTYIDEPLTESPPLYTGNVPAANESPDTKAPDTQAPDTKAVAKEQAAGVGQGAAEAGQHVAGVAKEQGAQVASEAGRQAKDLLNQAQGQLMEQTSAQQVKLVSGLKSLRDELGSMASNAENPGVASDLAREAADRTGSFASWLDGREPAAILDDVTSFARRRPGTFLAVAGGIGFLAGRLTRGLKAQSSTDDSAPASAHGAVDSDLVVSPVPPIGMYAGELR